MKNEFAYNDDKMIKTDKTMLASFLFQRWTVINIQIEIFMKGKRVYKIKVNKLILRYK